MSAATDISRHRLSLPQLCLIADPGLPDVIKIAEQALAAGVTMLQMRGHQRTAAEVYTQARRLRPLCTHYHTLLIINDRVDVGIAVHADGFQLGTRSLPLSVVRQLAGHDYLLGASVHSLAEAEEAVEHDADFLLAGTIFPSPSHPGEQAYGSHILRTMKEHLPDLPLLAIGGITVENAGQVMQAGADGIAVISAILHIPDPAQATRQLRAVIEKERSYE